jgi:hypothetical protein
MINHLVSYSQVQGLATRIQVAAIAKRSTVHLGFFVRQLPTSYNSAALPPQLLAPKITTRRLDLMASHYGIDILSDCLLTLTHRTIGYVVSPHKQAILTLEFTPCTTHTACACSDQSAANITFSLYFGRRLPREYVISLKSFTTLSSLLWPLHPHSLYVISLDSCVNTFSSCFWPRAPPESK